VGQTHIEFVGSEDAIATAKGELVEAIPASGRVFLNGDDARSGELALRSAAPVTRYGLSPGCDVRAKAIELDERSRAAFTLVAEGVSQPVQLTAPGRHNVYNALAASAVALELGVEPERIARGLAEAHLSDMRMQLVTTASGLSVLNDAYNASPASMKAALETLVGMATTGRRIAVLGDMAELGSYADLAHFRLGELVADLGVDALVAIGERAKRIAEAASGRVGSRTDVHWFAGLDEAARELPGMVSAGDVVLVKASRTMGLERLVDRLAGADA
jgi:UDP-N-acetylmuramoyl-tripeptide--D-alanyl-D-alanine ligase